MKDIKSLLLLVFFSITELPAFGGIWSVRTDNDIRQAIKDAIDGDTIQLTDNIENLSFALSFKNNLILDLCGYKITGTYTGNDTDNSIGLINVNNGTLTIIDSSAGNTGEIHNNSVNINPPAVTIGIYDTGSVIIKGGNITSSANYSIRNFSGKLTVSGDAHIHSADDTKNYKVSVGILNDSGTTFINGGYFSYDNSTATTKYLIRQNVNHADGTISITGGYFSANDIAPSSGYYLRRNQDILTKAAYPYHISNDTLTVYQWDSAQQSCTGKFKSLNEGEWGAGWSAIQSSSKNAISVVDECNADWASSQTNVLVEHTSSDGSKTYTCNNLVLTDLNDFYTPYTFTASKVSYTRSTTLRYNSLCLPFAITPEDVNGIIYDFGSYNSSAGTITMEEQPEGVVGGRACIFKSNVPGSDLCIEKENINVSSGIRTDGVMRGSYVLSTGFGGEGVYKLSSSGTSFGYTTSAAKCYSFRSYIDLSSLNAKGSSLSVVWTDNTFTQSVDIVDTNAPSYPTEHYSFNGMQTGSKPTGVNILKFDDGRVIKVIEK